MHVIIITPPQKSTSVNMDTMPKPIPILIQSSTCERGLIPLTLVPSSASVRVLS